MLGGENVGPAEQNIGTEADRDLLLNFNGVDGSRLARAVRRRGAEEETQRVFVAGELSFEPGGVGARRGRAPLSCPARDGARQRRRGR